MQIFRTIYTGNSGSFGFSSYEMIGQAEVHFRDVAEAESRARLTDTSSTSI
jgi:hypothetical protein